MDVEIVRSLAGASKAFEVLRQAVFRDAYLSLNTKRQVYRAYVLSVWLYGRECWTPLRKHLKKLKSFHHRCLRAVLGITNCQQWEQRISSATVRERWGCVETITTKAVRRRLEWLGHLARMSRSSAPQDLPIQLVAPDSSTRRTKEEVERSGQDRSEGSGSE